VSGVVAGPPSISSRYVVVTSTSTRWLTGGCCPRLQSATSPQKNHRGHSRWPTSPTVNRQVDLSFADTIDAGPSGEVTSRPMSLWQSTTDRRRDNQRRRRPLPSRVRLYTRPTTGDLWVELQPEFQRPARPPARAAPIHHQFGPTRRKDAPNEPPRARAEQAFSQVRALRRSAVPVRAKSRMWSRGRRFRSCQPDRRIAGQRPFRVIDPDREERPLPVPRPGQVDRSVHPSQRAPVHWSLWC
jgi:hypothetical protein